VRRLLGDQRSFPSAPAAPGYCGQCSRALQQLLVALEMKMLVLNSSTISS